MQQIIESLQKPIWQVIKNDFKLHDVALKQKLWRLQLSESHWYLIGEYCPYNRPSTSAKGKISASYNPSVINTSITATSRKHSSSYSFPF